jgi:hypothetical protein
MMTPEEAQQAARAAANEPADDGTPCAQAYAALASFSADFQKRTPWVPRSTPDRDEFMDGCRSLPQAQQQCLVPSYQRGHEDECRAALGGRGEPGGGTTP